MNGIDTSLLTPHGFVYLAPLFVLCAGMLALMLGDMLSRTSSRSSGLGLGPSLGISVTTAIVAALSCLYPLWYSIGDDAAVGGQLFVALGPQVGGGGEPSWWSTALSLDRFGTLAAFAICAILLVSLVLLAPYLRRRGLHRPELFPLLLASTVGMVLLGFSRDLLVTFAAIELLSLPLYVLCSLNMRDVLGRESSLKYFLLGAFASGFFIYGTALVYGSIGHLNYSAILYVITNRGGADGLLLTGLALVGVGLAFKLALVPFHAWVPDVYQGAPTPITGFMAAGVKFAAAAAFIRIVVEVVQALPPSQWQQAIAAFAALSMLVGNLLALHQMSAKRLLACSAIAHTGYLAVGLAAGTSAVSGDLLVYLISYAAAALGCFALVEHFAPAGQDDVFLDQVHELYQRAPLACIALAIMLLSLGGFPLTAGFIGKLLVFRDAWDAGLTGLVIFALLNSVVSFYYYLRFVMAMYMQPRVPGTEALAPAPMTRGVSAAVLALVITTLLIGVLPDNLLATANQCQLNRAYVVGGPPVTAHVEGQRGAAIR